MKLASIVPYSFLPYHSGGQKAIAQLYHYLGQQATVLVIGSAGNNAALATHYRLYPLLGSSVWRYANPLIFFRVKKLLQQQGINLVIIEHPYHAWLGWLLKKAGFTVVLKSHNIEFARFRSIHKWWWPLLKQYEQWAFRLAHLALFITEEDRSFGIQAFRLPASKCHVLPFGVPQQQPPLDKQQAKQQLLAQWQLPVNTVLLLFTGSYGYQPNVDAVQYILDEIAPRLQLWTVAHTILITGKNLPQALQQQIQAKHPNVLYAGFVAGIEEYFTGADLLLNTVLSGGGVKTKLVEAIGCNTTVVSTTTGAIGVDAAVCGDKLQVVPDNDWDAFVRSIQAHAGSQAITPPAFYQTYYWGNITAKLVAMLKALHKSGG